MSFVVGDNERILAETKRWVIIEGSEEPGSGLLRVIHKIDGVEVFLTDGADNVLQFDSVNGAMVVGELETGDAGILVYPEKK